MILNIKKSLLIFSLSVLISLHGLATEISSHLVGFSPDGSALNVILTGIADAQHSIDVAAYSFTSSPIASALVDASKRGVKVRVVADAKANNTRYTAVTFLANQGVPVRLNSHYAIMHNKYMIIDGQSLQTGSFNYTAGASKRNAENVVFLKNVPDMAKRYLQDFERLYAEGTPFSPAHTAR